MRGNKYYLRGYMNKKKKGKWQPRRIELEAVKILREEKEILMNELAKMIFEIKEKVNLETMEVYEKS
jgi:hypothetical protein